MEVQQEGGHGDEVMIAESTSCSTTAVPTTAVFAIPHVSVARYCCCCAVAEQTTRGTILYYSYCCHCHLQLPIYLALRVSDMRDLHAVLLDELS